MHRSFLLSSAILLLGSAVLRSQEAATLESSPSPVAEKPAETAPVAGVENPTAVGDTVDASVTDPAMPAPEAAPAEEAAAVAESNTVSSDASAAANGAVGMNPDATTDAIPVPAPVPAAPSAPAPDSRAELLAARVSLMEQLLLAQHDREVTLYRDTIRLISIFGGAFAGLCMIGLLAAAFLNYRALVAVQNMYARVPNNMMPIPASSMLPVPTAEVPGIERVQASGQRFQTRMSGLEQRLSELEHLAGREAPPPGADDVSRADTRPRIAEEAALIAPPPTPMIPRAMILVHKAQTLANLGKLTEALTTLDEASAFNGAKTEVHLARGQVLEKLGRLGDALKAYDTAVDVDDHNTSALLLKAGVLNRQERFSEALACYERALEVHRATV